MSVRTGSVETRASWVVATVALIVLSVSYGAPLTTMVALKPIAAEFGATRSAPALAVGLTFIGAGSGGIAMGWLAERIGVRAVVLFGAAMIGAGLTISSLGGLTQLYISSFLLVGLLGAAGMFAPLMTYVSRWFDVRRGTAIALISAGQVRCGCAVAGGLPAGHRYHRLAPHHAGLCRLRRRPDSAAGGDLSAAPA